MQGYDNFHFWKPFHFLKIGSMRTQEKSDTTAKSRGLPTTQEPMSPEKITKVPEWTLGKNARRSVLRWKPASTGCGTQRGTLTRELVLLLQVSTVYPFACHAAFYSLSTNRLQGNQEGPNYSVRTKVLQNQKEVKEQINHGNVWIANKSRRKNCTSDKDMKSSL